jgi:hypothetical protein
MSRPETMDVLIIDDDEAIRGMLAAALARLGMTCDTAADGAEALDCVAMTRYSVVLVVLMITAFPVRDHASELGRNVQAVIQKPFDVVELAELVHDCVTGRPLHVSSPSELGTHPPSALAAAERTAGAQVLPLHRQKS